MGFNLGFKGLMTIFHRAETARYGNVPAGETETTYTTDASQLCMYTWMWVYAYMCMHTNMCKYMYKCTYIHIYVCTWGGQDDVVSIATCYRLEGLGIETWWGARFSTPVQTGPGAHPASYTMDTGSLSRGVKRPGRGVQHPPPSSAKIKERVELYLYPFSGPLWPPLGWTLPLPTYVHKYVHM